MAVHHLQSEIRCEPAHRIRITRHIQHVSCLKHCIRGREFLRDSLKEPVLRALTPANLEQIESILIPQIQINYCPADNTRAGDGLETEQIMRKTIFLDQLVE